MKVTHLLSRTDVGLFVLVLSLFVFGVSCIIVQTKSEPVYVLDLAVIVPFRENPAENQIEIAFWSQFPDPTDVENVDNWLVQSLSEDRKAEYRPLSAKVEGHVEYKLARLEMAQSFGFEGELDPIRHRVTIVFLKANQPRVIAGQTRISQRVWSALIAGISGNPEAGS